MSIELAGIEFVNRCLGLQSSFAISNIVPEPFMVINVLNLVWSVCKVGLGIVFRWSCKMLLSPCLA